MVSSPAGRMMSSFSTLFRFLGTAGQSCGENGVNFTLQPNASGGKLAHPDSFVEASLEEGQILHLLKAQRLLLVGGTQDRNDALTDLVDVPRGHKTLMSGFKHCSVRHQTDSGRFHNS